MRHQEKKNLIITGFFVSSLLAIFMVFAILIGKENQWFAKKVKLKAKVPSARNLRSGGAVQFQGIKIGKVESIKIQGQDEVGITIEIDEEFLQWIKKDSTVDISSQGLVGDKLLKIKTGGESSPAFDPGSDVLRPHPSMNMPDLTQTGGEIAEQFDRVLAKLDLFLDQANKDAAVATTLHNMSQAATRLNNLLGDMEKRGFSKNMSSAMSGLDKTMKRMNNGPGTMHSLIYEDELYNRMNQIVGGAGRSDVLKYFIRKSLDETENETENEKENEEEGEEDVEQ